MQRKDNSKLVPLSRELRKNMTKEERHLWYDFLNTYPVRFMRQRILGNYIADFYCAQAKLVIELDGSQHYSEEGLIKDRIRTSRLESRGLTVLHIPNCEITRNFSGVCEYIDLIIRGSVSESLHR